MLHHEQRRPRVAHRLDVAQEQPAARLRVGLSPIVAEREARLVARDAYQNIGRVKRLSEANTRLEAQLSAAVERGDEAERRRAEMEASIAPMAEEKARQQEQLFADEELGDDDLDNLY